MLALTPSITEQNYTGPFLINLSTLKRDVPEFSKKIDFEKAPNIHVLRS